MKEWPTLYTAPMIRAQLAGTKWQTRRPLYVLTKHGRTACFDRRYPPPAALPPVGYCWTLSRWHRAAPGDLIWARENCWERPERTPKMMREGADTWAPFYYDADGITEQEAADFKAWGFKRRPSIHMPRAACRINRTITANRVERLHDISLADARAEGIVPCHPCGWHVEDGSHFHAVDPRRSYLSLWQAINGNAAEDPWVCAISFERVQQQEQS